LSFIADRPKSEMRTSGGLCSDSKILAGFKSPWMTLLARLDRG
jgi:hypothetical protein